MPVLLSPTRPATRKPLWSLMGHILSLYYAVVNSKVQNILFFLHPLFSVPLGLPPCLFLHIAGEKRGWEKQALTQTKVSFLKQKRLLSNSSFLGETIVSFELSKIV